MDFGNPPPGASVPVSEPSLKEVESLSEVGKGAIVNLDEQGRVRSVRRQRMLEAGWMLVYVVFAGSVMLLVRWHFPGLGFLPLAVAAVAAVGLALILRQARTIKRAEVLVHELRLDEAEELLLPFVGRFWVASPSKVAAWAFLGTIAELRGEHGLGLERVRTALLLVEKKLSSRLAAARAMLRYSEVRLLVTLGRLDEAQALVSILGPEPEPEFLRLQHWMCALYLDFARGKTGLEAAAAVSWADRVRPLRAFPGLKALLAWALAEKGEEALSQELLEMAFAVETSPRLARAMPRLWAWMFSARRSPQDTTVHLA